MRLTAPFGHPPPPRQPYGLPCLGPPPHGRATRSTHVMSTSTTLAWRSTLCAARHKGPATMPSLLSVIGVTGDGSAVFPGGMHTATDIDSVVTAVSPNIHLFPVGVDWRVQHVGWFGLGIGGIAGSGAIGNPSVDILWWDYITFALADTQLPPQIAAVPIDTLVWHIAIGCTVNLNVTG